MDMALRRPLNPRSSSPRVLAALEAILLILPLLGFSFPASAIDLDPYACSAFSRDPMDFSLARQERPSFYWVNIGLPDSFFTGVKKTSTSPTQAAFSVRSLQYDLGVGGWLTDQIHLGFSI